MRKTKLIISICLILIWIGVIFGFSSKSGDESNAQSKGIIQSVAETAITHSNEKNKTINGKYVAKKTSTIAEMLNVIVRKSAHASIFCVLSILVMKFILILKGENKFRYYIVGMVICFLYACTDEFHQLYVPGRTGRFTDALIDTLGATIGCVVIWGIYKIKSKIKVKE